MKLEEKQISRLQEVIEKFPELKEVAWKLSESGIFWALASGTAAYIYAGGKKDDLDDVDLWIAAEDKGVVTEILGEEWQGQSSPNHMAENIAFDSLDFFTNCRKIRGEEVLLDYRWTKSVDEHLVEVSLDGVDYQIVSPEDVVVLKMVNSREKDQKDVLALEKMGLDKKYLRQRLAECGVTIVF
ncbi:MAG: nucleotidyltransferase [Patescibacteria group bacterium]|nr:nucleotidyltransferase [Patescibacteria group bacterium]